MLFWFYAPALSAHNFYDLDSLNLSEKDDVCISFQFTDPDVAQYYYYVKKLGGLDNIPVEEYNRLDRWACYALGAIQEIETFEKKTGARAVYWEPGDLLRVYLEAIEDEDYCDVGLGDFMCPYVCNIKRVVQSQCMHEQEIQVSDLDRSLPKILQLLRKKVDAEPDGGFRGMVHDYFKQRNLHKSMQNKK